MKGSVLITGGSGFVGSHIVDAFSKRANLTAIVYDVSSADRTAGSVVSINGNVFDSDRLLKVLRDREVDTVIHLVGLVSIPQCRSNPDVSFRLNVSSVQRVLETMRLADARRLIFPSTGAVYGAVKDQKVGEETEPNPTSVYGCHKLAAESLIRGYAENYGFKTTILRLFNVYGDLEKEQGVISLFIRSAMVGKPLVIEGGGQIRDFVHLNDVIKAFTTALDNPAACQKTINIGSGFGLSIREVAELVKSGFPKVEVEYKPLNKKDNSYYADVSHMKALLRLDPINPRIGIPKFIEACAER